MKSAICSSVILAAAVAAAPAAVEKRASNIDGVIINYALTLEHLESAFYGEGLARFDAAAFQKAGVDDPNFYTKLNRISEDEKVHVVTLNALAIGAGIKPVKACTYDFGITDAASFVNIASVLEGVGVSAYLGAAGQVTNKGYLTAAASILTIEARHNAYIRYSKGQSPFPQAFDTPLGFNQVYSLAAPFIKSCPSENPKLPVKAFPALKVKNAAKTPFASEAKVVFSVGASDKTFNSNNVYVAWPSIGGSVYTKATISGDKRTATAKIPAKMPTGPNGQAYAVLVIGKGGVTDGNTIAGPAIVNVLA